jgi:hypothetical protein
VSTLAIRLQVMHHRIPLPSCYQPAAAGESIDRRHSHPATRSGENQISSRLHLNEAADEFRNLMHVARKQASGLGRWNAPCANDSSEE